MGVDLANNYFPCQLVGLFRYNCVEFLGVGSGPYEDSSQDLRLSLNCSLGLNILTRCGSLPVLWYGRLEYIFGCIKMFFLSGLILFNVVINTLQRVPHSKGGTWTYDDPYSFSSKNITVRVDSQGNDLVVVKGNAGIFLAMWTAMTTIVFSMIGFETVSISAAECAPLRSTEAIKMGTRKICIRVFTLYTLCVLVVGFNVPYTDTNLRELAINSFGQGQNSIYILAAVRNNIHGWPNFFCGFFIFCATTSGINSLYLSSRILHALASIREVWPENSLCQGIRSRIERTTWGVPHGAVFVSWLFGLLAFLSTKQEPTIVSWVHSSIFPVQALIRRSN